jgi:hypothetical protein
VAVKKGGVPRGLEFDRGGTTSLPTPLQPSTQLARSSSSPHPAARPSRRRIRPKRAAIPVFLRGTWQRDLGRPENREFVGVLERGLVCGTSAARLERSLTASPSAIISAVMMRHCGRERMK